MDKKLFLFLYSKAENNKIIEKISAVGTKLSYHIFVLIFAVFGVYAVFMAVNKHDLIMAVKYFLIPLMVFILNTSLRKVFKKERPFLALGKKSLIGKKNSYSFPSNHAASAMVISIAVIYTQNGINAIGAAVLPLAFLTGISRIFAGVHYPSDVLFGWLIGGLLGYLGFFCL